MRLTTIVATIGPASSSPDVLEKMIRAGVDVFRLNFSHGSPETHKQSLDLVRQLARQTGRYVAVLQDLPGPKIRVGPLTGDTAELVTDSIVRIRRGAEPGDARGFGSTYDALVDDVRVGDTVLLSDGKLSLVVLEKTPEEAVCRVTVGGVITSYAGINLPGVRVSSPAATERDLEFLAWGIANDVDYVALSFVRDADDIRRVKQFLHDRNSDIPVVAKIEKPEAVEHLAAIIEAADALMVARGDLGVEMRLETVPILQKRMIHMCMKARKPVITATQMLESMTEHAGPTRAEVSDVANAILDGSDAVMLSGETAVGRYPVQVVHTMARIAEEADRYAADHHAEAPSPRHLQLDPEALVSSSLTYSVKYLAEVLKPAVVVVSTASGYTARNLSKNQLPMPILALSPEERTCRRMSLYRGVVADLVSGEETVDELAAHAAQTILARGLAREGALFALIAGFPVGRAGTTNTIQVRRLEPGHKLAEAGPRRARWTLTRGREVTSYAVDYVACIGCGVCVRRCPYGIFELSGERAVVNEENLPRCIGDRACVRGCPTGAISISTRPTGQSS